MTRAKRFTLSDGSTYTAQELADKIGLTATACRYRMTNSLKVEDVFRENHHPVTRKKHKCKTFTLSDDSVMTAEAIAKRFDVNVSTMYARLLRGQRDVLDLCKKPAQGRQRNCSGYTPVNKQPKAVKEYLMERNSFHPMSRLFMTMA